MSFVSSFSKLIFSATQQVGSLLSSKLYYAVPSSHLSTLALGKQPLLGVQKLTVQPVRHRILYNHLHGREESVQEVVDRFFRLHNGLWIRTRASKNSKRWKKPSRKMNRLNQHVFCTDTQCRTLDRMVNREYKVPHYMANDPYEVYHRKSNLPDYRYQAPKFFP